MRRSSARDLAMRPPTGLTTPCPASITSPTPSPGAHPGTWSYARPGARFVKKTVTSTTRHTPLYGDEQGHPGDPLLPWEHAATGRNGDGLTEETAFRVPAASMGC